MEQGVDSSSVVAVELEEATGETTTSVRVVANWARFLRKAWGIRKLQRYFSHIGKYLQTVEEDCRKTLIRVYQKEK